MIKTATIELSIMDLITLRDATQLAINNVENQGDELENENEHEAASEKFNEMEKYEKVLKKLNKFLK